MGRTPNPTHEPLTFSLWSSGAASLLGPLRVGSGLLPVQAHHVLLGCQDCNQRGLSLVSSLLSKHANVVRACIHYRKRAQGAQGPAMHRPSCDQLERGS